MSYQKVIIVGNLGRDPELRYTANGTAVCNLSVAVNKTYRNSDDENVEETSWFRVAVWDRQAEVAAQYLKKGRQVLVEGTMISDQDTGGPKVWEDSSGNARASHEVRAVAIKFLDSRPQESGEEMEAEW